jgi:RNA polymerase sigma factor (TIGR02999 family)
MSAGSKLPPDAPQPGAIDPLTEGFYAEMHVIAKRLFASEEKGHTLQPTAIVNEACLRLLSTSRLPDIPEPERLALAARVLKQVLIDHHRRRSADKRGAGALRIELEPEVLDRARQNGISTQTAVDFEAVHAALERLRGLHERQAEVVTLRVFGGLTMEAVASALSISKRSAEADWTVARAWLRRELAGGSSRNVP